MMIKFLFSIVFGIILTSKLYCWACFGDYNQENHDEDYPPNGQDLTHRQSLDDDNCGLGSYRFEWMKKANSFGCKSSQTDQSNGRSIGINLPATRVNGGYIPQIAEFPSFVQIIGLKLNDHRGYCGGVVIDNDLVLTAAHCIRDSPETVGYLVYAGSVESGQGVRRQVSRACGPKSFIKEQDNNAQLGTNDWAIIQLRSRLDYGSSIQPACINLEAQLDPSARCIVVGMGRTMEGGRRSPTLKAGIMRQCIGEPRLKVDGTLCYEASANDTWAGKACKGDSGGPLYCYSNCHHRTKMVVVGVVSGGKTDTDSRRHGAGQLKHVQRSTCVIQNQEIFTDLSAHGKDIETLFRQMQESSWDSTAGQHFDCQVFPENKSTNVVSVE